MQQRRSAAVTVAFLAGFALAVEGCDEDSYEHCVDEDGQVVDPALCSNNGSGHYVYSGTGGHVYRYWYGGRTPMGEHISGGSYEAPASGVTSVHGTSAHGSVTHGGFGRRSRGRHVMQRFTCAPRANWRGLVEEQGMLYHTTQDTPYWNESAYYAFSLPQIERIERVSAELNEMCIAAVGNVIEHSRYAELGIPELAIPLIEYS